MKLSDDLLKGVKQIANHTGDGERRTYYLLEHGLIPGFKIGAIWHARKSSLDAHYGGPSIAAAQAQAAS